MQFSDLFAKLEKHKYYVFTYEDLQSFYPQEKKSNLKKIIYRWRKNGWITPLKRGLYELTYPRDLIIPDLYIGNKLYSPSYVSLETALSHYSIIPEISMAVTSLTTKPTRKFKNKHGLFMYRTIRPKLFRGYYVEKQGRFEILIAEPEKAIIDYIYFKTYRGKTFDFAGERFDKDSISRLKKRKLDAYARGYNISTKEFYAYLRSVD